jgi:hypothetical protein
MTRAGELMIPSERLGALSQDGNRDAEDLLEWMA